MNRFQPPSKTCLGAALLTLLLGPLAPVIASPVGEGASNSNSADTAAGAAPIEQAAVAAAEPRARLPKAAAPIVDEAQRLFKAGRLAEAEKLYREALLLDENSVFLLANLAAIQIELNRFADAETSLIRALEGEANNPYVLSLLGFLRFRQGNLDDALDALKRAATLDPTNAETQIFLGVSLAQSGQVEAAEAALRTAIELAPANAMARHNLAVVHATRKAPQLASARIQYAKAIRLGHPRNEGLEDVLRKAGFESVAESTLSLPSEVGAFTDPDRLVFEGSETFSPQAIKAGLFRHAEFLLVSHPLAPFGDYLEALETMIGAGYKSTGFPDVEVLAEADLDRERIVVALDEGRRYTKGDVTVVGARTIPVDRLILRLTQTFPPREGVPIGPLDNTGKRLDKTGKEIKPSPPVWTVGKPVSFHAPEIQNLTSAVTNALADFGYWFPKATVRIVRVPDENLANLRVEILEEGPRDTLDEIEIKGNETNSRETILEFLNLPSGSLINRDLIDTIERALWRSARFLHHETTVRRTEADPSQVNVHIDVLEYDKARPLLEALSPEEETLLKTQDDPGSSNPVVRMDTLFAPVAFLSLAHRTNMALAFKDSLLVLTNATVRIEIDRSTGRPRAFPYNNDGEGLGFRFGRYLFGQSLGDVQALTRDHPNGFESQRPVSSLLGFAADELLVVTWLLRSIPDGVSLEKRGQAAGVLRKLFAQEILAPLDEYVREHPGKSAEAFTIPLERTESQEQALQILLATTAAWGFKYCQDLFPTDSWPVTVARETALVLRGNTQYTDRELQRLYESEAIGPVFFLTAAKLLDLLKSPASDAFASRGLTRLTVEDFRKDYRLLLDGDSPFPRSVERAARALRDLKDEEVRQLAAVLPEETGLIFHAMARLLRESDGKPIQEVLATVLDQAWEDFLRDKVQNSLMNLARPSPAI